MKSSLLFVFAVLCLAVILTVYSCQKQAAPESQSVAAVAVSHHDTVTTLASFTADTAVWHHDGQYTLVTREPDRDDEAEAEEGEAQHERITACSDAFAGSARSAAKTSYASVSYGTYATINALRVTLPTDAYMQGLGITNSSPRVSEENRNRDITTAYLYAIARESDNDFHMIIGDANSAAGNLLNCEASGNPPSTQSSYAAISAVRSYLKSYFGTDFCGQSGYTKFSPALRLTVLKGSLFFDIDHAAGAVGPTGLRPNTAWEMHPIHNITF
ncbi:hypothetical protein [Flavisolibacter ginsenosidimutans]|uniref:Lipoprotein n=1 Tax=Flavisolibacter ginsenosidimutans TaxID=661481 RepID=A0A5B8UL15_9BACT|nr:hypothetical protein [Flavisolibacter ginsenosidimutans]QEC56720.1 hypothetical protein FSB75_12700 [Flavisolibacter ginsenosidimutans]